ncbi:acyl-CoA synthetase [Sphingomonas montanisoli]|uniref:3-methylmercaptopropionyl-CoA ligase n=1 Tax=Sphingomonas montanisoli TaxID=2606412 RepID=A0A5D9BZY9_9SPHN|nr:long-chain fatty acid--CoA ligase [Sphingomonas montanisoli]TZG24989.1 long-chain fatty acid--CoA ligase [Sphingomonas montanisoli]
MQATLSIRSNARRRGGEIALMCEDRSFTWAQLHDLIARFAAILRDEGVRPGDRIAILADNCDLYLSAFFAIPWAGAVLLPLNTRLNPAELAELLETGDPSLILFDAGRADLLERTFDAGAKRVPTLAMRGQAHSIDALQAKAAPMDDLNRHGNDPASIFFTGGTTGRSKGAVMTHANHMFNSLGMWTELGADTSEVRYLHAPPMFHVADALFVHAVTAVGGCHVLLPRFDAVAVIDAIERHGITDVYLVPTMVGTFLDELERNPRTLPTLRRLYYGAMPMPEEVVRRFMKMLPQCGPVQLYGQSEAGPILTMLLPRDHDVSGKTTRLRSAGLPMPGAEIAIHDEQGQEVEQGVVGEIVARAGTVMPGYWNDPEQTAKALRDGWLYTGDGGYVDADGFVYVVDRIKDMIISGGENIYSIEVERAISKHPAVSQCAVIGVPDPRWGERVHAAIVLRAGAAVSTEEMQAHCRQHIAGYKIPRSIDWRASLPLSGPGKILKRKLRDEVLEQA